MKLCGKAIEEVHKEVIRQSGGLPKGALWALRGNEENLNEERLALRQAICQEHAKIGRAMAIKDFLADIWNYATAEETREHLKAVMGWCSRSRMEPLVSLARSLKAHMEGTLGYFKNDTTSAAIEAINGLLQLARRRARGYRNFADFQAIAYWIAGRLEIPLPVNTTH